MFISQFGGSGLASRCGVTSAASAGHVATTTPLMSAALTEFRCVRFIALPPWIVVGRFLSGSAWVDISGCHGRTCPGDLDKECTVLSLSRSPGHKGVYARLRGLCPAMTLTAHKWRDCTRPG